MRPPYKNLTVFAGRIGNDPELRYLASGDATISLRVCCQESFKDASSSTGWSTHSEWATLVFYRKDAEDVAASGVAKGGFIYAEGRRHTRQWKDGQGHPKTAHEIIVSAWHPVAVAAAAAATERVEAAAQRSAAPTKLAPAPAPARGSTESLA